MPVCVNACVCVHVCVCVCVWPSQLQSSYAVMRQLLLDLNLSIQIDIVSTKIYD